ncbi:molybdate ABC transporter substrate-binding protein [Spirulina sp. CCNP1310]|uniref:molybdate ABC transporter substrate-binding protein n=1 Tax=Spirulina sp. CCNP1310 TaxID=3110249 RepID=UPI002B20D352|nr:molybdate ABC transporter substrate-binding protein [Spirulina sp. CCNP1310]MEA5420726.1 molybdate ABC transporter substrate-binding protein [Spirulina sp. CCNP1310]
MLRFVCLILIGCLVACGLSKPPNPSLLTVSAAANLQAVLPVMGERWERTTGGAIAFNFGSTGQLAQQIERGAAVDLFLAADQDLIEALDRQGLIRSGSKRIYAVGRIVIWQRQDSPLRLATLADLTRPEVQRVAIANPNHAPYGIAARQALESAGIWAELQPKLILGENIQQAQHYAAMGNVDVAITALSLSMNRPGRWTLIPAELHTPLTQMLAIPRHAPHPELAQAFADFITGEEGRSLLTAQGFALPPVAQP